MTRCCVFPRDCDRMQPRAKSLASVSITILRSRSKCARIGAEVNFGFNSSNALFCSGPQNHSCLSPLVLRVSVIGLHTFEKFSIKRR